VLSRTISYIGVICELPSLNCSNCLVNTTRFGDFIAHLVVVVRTRHASFGAGTALVRELLWCGNCFGAGPRLVHVILAAFRFLPHFKVCAYRLAQFQSGLDVVLNDRFRIASDNLPYNGRPPTEQCADTGVARRGAPHQRRGHLCGCSSRRGRRLTSAKPDSGLVENPIETIQTSSPHRSCPISWVSGAPLLHQPHR
jgi:hypothetical protein